MGEELNEEEKKAIENFAELDTQIDSTLDDIDAIIATYDEIINDNNEEDA